MILISAHQDVVRTDIPMRFEEGKLVGLLDNYIGQFVALSVMNNNSIKELEKQGKVKFFFNQHEEFGLSVGFPDLDRKKDIVINVDICAGKRYKNKDIGLENCYKLPTFVIPSLKWEGFKITTFEWEGNDPDEADQWVEKKIPVVSFIVPIDCPNDNWHGEASIPFERIQKAILILTRLICYLS